MLIKTLLLGPAFAVSDLQNPTWSFTYIIICKFTVCIYIWSFILSCSLSMTESLGIIAKSCSTTNSSPVHFFRYKGLMYFKERWLILFTLLVCFLSQLRSINGTRYRIGRLFLHFAHMNCLKWVSRLIKWFLKLSRINFNFWSIRSSVKHIYVILANWKKKLT